MEEEKMDDSDPKFSIPGYESINEFSQQTLKSVLQATRSSNDLPVGDDFDFYSTFSSVRDVLDMEGQRILSLLQRILRHQNVKGNIGASTSIDLEDRFDVLMDSNDQILERAGTLLDEASGVKKQEAKLVLASASKPKVSTSWNKKFVSPSNTSKQASAYRLLTARNIQRPQVRFKDKIDNSNCPFKPILKKKPNASKTLKESLKLPESVSLEDLEMCDFVHPHPYAYELEEFTPSSDLLTKVKPQEPQPVTLTPLIYVDKTDQLNNLVEDLKKVKVIGVDLEHHSYRSFQGFTCLMQISTRSHDYIVDTIELRDDLQVLNEVFTDPKITKVFHGAEMDINWLQRDLGLYVVNLFDTGQAARLLNLPRFSLAHLLVQYCRVEADKQFQLADWRIRPLPQELINYAREDTHYLLYIYDMMRNQLLDSGNDQANLLQSVYTRSKLVASQVYRKPIFKDTDYLDWYRKSRKVFNNQQLAALKDLFGWRNQMARLEDESLGYVLPNHMLLQIAEILPREHQGVLACCNPIPPLVRQNLPELHKMILKARELALTKVEKTVTSQPTMSQHPKYDADSLLHCRHDMTRQEETIADVERIIAETGIIASLSSSVNAGKKNEVKINPSPAITAFSSPVNSQNSITTTKDLVDRVTSLFTNPFTKFLAKAANIDIKPACDEIWVLKCSTNKRKVEHKDDANVKVDLDSFEPEYAPPSKRPKVTVNLNLTTSRPASNATNSEKSKNIQRGSGTDAAGSGKSKKQDIKSKITSKLQSLRDEVFKVKKRLKEVEDKKKSETSTTTDSVGQKTAETNNGNSHESVGENSTENVVEKKQKLDDKNTNNGNKKDKEENTKKKKKKQKKNVMSNEEFKGFDYEAAEAQLQKEANKAKKKDVYNPRLPNLDKKKKGKKGGKAGKMKSKGNTDD